jgi:hypothetical protein
MSNEFEGCDGVLWHIEVKINDNGVEHEVDSTIYKYPASNIEPDELGFKYHILRYKEDKSDVEVLTAYIGDVAHFVNNHARAGYNGLLVKNKCVPKKTVKEMFRRILTNWDFSPKIISSVVKQV